MHYFVVKSITLIFKINGGGDVYFFVIFREPSAAYFDPPVY